MRFFVAILFGFSVFTAPSPNYSKTFRDSMNQQEDIREGAFNVLREKCNVCHATKKRTDVFTLENMDSLARVIREQVFEKRKMPKGRKINLTESEKQTLKHWIEVVLKNK